MLFYFVIGRLENNSGIAGSLNLIIFMAHESFFPRHLWATKTCMCSFFPGKHSWPQQSHEILFCRMHGPQKYFHGISRTKDQKSIFSLKMDFKKRSMNPEKYMKTLFKQNPCQ